MIQKSYEISKTYRQVFLEYYKDLKEKFTAQAGELLDQLNSF